MCEVTFNIFFNLLFAAWKESYHWGSSQQLGRVPGETLAEDRVTRIKTSGTLLVGKFQLLFGQFWANNEGAQVGPLYEPDEDIEFLTKEPACTLLRMPYTTGGLLPAEVISGGRLPDGPLTRYGKLRVGHAPGIPGTFSPPSTSKETAS